MAIATHISVAAFSLANVLTEILASLAVLLIVTAGIGVMLGAIKPADALRSIGALVGVFVLLAVLICNLMNLWAALPLAKKIGLVAPGVALLLWLALRRPVNPGGRKG